MKPLKLREVNLAMEENKQYLDFLRNHMDEGIDQNLIEGGQMLDKVNRYRRQRQMFRMLGTAAAFFILASGILFFNYRTHSLEDTEFMSRQNVYSAVEEIQIVELLEEIELYEEYCQYES